MKHSPRFLALVREISKNIREIETSEVLKKIQKKANFLLIDVREDSEWSRGHLPHAMHLGKGLIERDIEKKVPDLDQEIVLYCGGGYRSAIAAESIQKMGYTNVYSMAGGFRSWVDEGRPVVEDSRVEDSTKKA